MKRRLLTLACILALLLPALPVSAIGLLICTDDCCGEACDEPCDEPGSTSPGEGSDSECPADCPDCVCSPLHRVAISPDAGAVPPEGGTTVPMAEHGITLPDAAPREILHVPRG